LGLPLSEIKRINSLPEKSRGLPGQTLLLPGPLNRETADTLKDWRTPLYPSAENKKDAPKGKTQLVSDKNKAGQPRGAIAKPSKAMSLKKLPAQSHSVFPSKTMVVKPAIAKH
jgi:hypothetical protein